MSFYCVDRSSPTAATLLKIHNVTSHIGGGYFSSSLKGRVRLKTVDKLYQLKQMISSVSGNISRQFRVYFEKNLSTT